MTTRLIMVEGFDVWLDEVTQRSDVGQRFDSIGASVSHVKLILEAGNNFLMGNPTGKGQE